MSFDESVPVYSLDPRGHVVEHVNVDGQEVHLHYRDIPESEITTLHGLRLTTPLPTVIDIASTVDGTHSISWSRTVSTEDSSPSRRPGRGDEVQGSTSATLGR